MTKSSTTLQLAERAPAAALVMAFGDHAAIERFLIDGHGLPLPGAGKRIDRKGLSALFVAPGKWLLFADGGPANFAVSLSHGLLGVAAVTDQSDGLRTFRLSGDRASELLQNCVAIDLHPSRFPSGSATATMVGLIRTHLSRIDDTPTYELSVARSLADSLASHILNHGDGRACTYSPLSQSYTLGQKA